MGVVAALLIGGSIYQKQQAQSGKDNDQSDNDAEMGVVQTANPGAYGQPVAAAVPVASAQPVAQPQQQMMEVVVPEGVGPGQQIMVQSPAGSINVVVPAGVGPGMMFQVAIPAPAPVAVATAVAT